MIPASQDTSFLAFSAELEIRKNSFALSSSFTFRSTAIINPIGDTVSLSLGAFAADIPPGSFIEAQRGFYSFDGKVGGVRMKASIKPAGTMRYSFQAEAQGVNLAVIEDPFPVTLAIGEESGTTKIKPQFHD